MTEKDRRYSALLDKQIKKYKKETRHLEFKSNYQSPEKLGQYVSALSNGACLDREDYGYLYFGVDDNTLAIKGTTFDVSKEKAKGNQSLELYIRGYISPKINFKIEEFRYNDNERIVRIKIPAAQGEPTLYDRTPCGRIDSHCTNIQQYADWMRALYNSQKDWSAEVVGDATFADLDPKAIHVAREGYKQRYPEYAEESDKWDDMVFLDKASLTIDGEITRTTLLLVGKKESVSKLPHISQIVWSCVQDGETFGDIFTIPFVLSTTNILGRIRNYRFKIYPDNSLIPAEVWKYDTRSILEGLHNCILHQDYTLNERILVKETKDMPAFENAGSFFSRDYTQYIEGTKTPKKYRNKALANAMVSIKMVDSLGYGIHNLFLRQKERFLPMPDYEGSDENKVVLNMPGVVIDVDYSLLLMNNTSLTLTDTYLLDQVQKHRPIPEDAIAYLRSKKLIEGRRPTLYLSKSLSQKTGKKIEYSRHKGLEDATCEQVLFSAIKEHNSLDRKDIDKLLWNALSDQLTDKQKQTKIGNILTKLRKKGKIHNSRKNGQSIWYPILQN